MQDKVQELKEHLGSICEKYHCKWSIDQASDINDLSVVEVQDIAILMTRASQQSDASDVSSPICDAPNSDVIFELLARLMEGDAKNHEELISDLVSQLRSNAVCYYTTNNRINKKLQQAYEEYCSYLTSVDAKADDAYEEMRQREIDGVN